MTVEFCTVHVRLRDILLHEVSSAGAVDLSIKIGALRLRNPILAASGTFGYGLEFAHLIDLNRLGGFVTKGLSREPIEGAPAPRLYPTPSGMLNAVGLQNVGVRAFVAEKLPVLRNFDTAVIANVFGYTLEDYVEVIRVLEDAEGLAGYELNVSCPNVKKGGMQFGSDPGRLEEAPLGQTFPSCYGHWTYRPGRRGSRRGCPDRGKHLSRHGHRFPLRKVPLGKSNRGLVGSGD